MGHCDLAASLCNRGHRYELGTVCACMCACVRVWVSEWVKENEPPSAPLLHVHVFPLRTVGLLQLCSLPAVTVMSSCTRTLCSCHIKLHPGCQGSRQGGTLHHPERVACPRPMSAQWETLFCWLLPLLPPPQRLLLILRLESWTVFVFCIKILCMLLHLHLRCCCHKYQMAVRCVFCFIFCGLFLICFCRICCFGPPVALNRSRVIINRSSFTAFCANVQRMQLRYISQFFSISQLVCPQIPAIAD